MIGIIFDIDGVITDGTLIVDFNGSASKRINLKDIDAINELHRDGFFIGAVTAEKNEFTEYIRKIILWNVFLEGAMDKGQFIHRIRAMGCDRVVYIGDGKKDLSAFEQADIKICPKDAIPDIKEMADYIMDDKAGKGGLWEIVDLARDGFFSESFVARSEWNRTLDEHIRTMRMIKDDTEYPKLIVRAAELITDAVLNNHRVVIFGNGGSAADAQHIAAEYVSRFKIERRSLDMEALTVNTSVLTALGNDYSYDDVFARQVEGMTKVGDVAIGITTSGTSKNVRKALDIAMGKGLKTILLTGDLKEATQYNVTLCVKSNVTARVQEVHILTGHYWAEYTEKRLQELH